MLKKFLQNRLRTLYDGRYFGLTKRKFSPSEIIYRKLYGWGLEWYTVPKYRPPQKKEESNISDIKYLDPIKDDTVPVKLVPKTVPEAEDWHITVINKLEALAKEMKGLRYAIEDIERG